MVSTHPIGTGKKPSSDKPMKMPGECGNVVVGKSILPAGPRKRFHFLSFLPPLLPGGAGQPRKWESARLGEM